MTIQELLATKEFRGNQSLLARELKINRLTFAKYMGDKEGKHHFVSKTDNGYHFYINLTDKVSNLKEGKQ